MLPGFTGLGGCVISENYLNGKDKITLAKGITQSQIAYVIEQLMRSGYVDRVVRTGPDSN